MPMKLSVKRNSLSSKWGVWSIDSDADSPSENLVAQLPTSEAAEAYCERVMAGDNHDAVMEDLTGKRVKKNGGGGIFKKLLKRSNGSSPDATEGVRQSNPVIEIEPQKPATADPEPAQAPAVPEAAPAEAQSRFEVIQQAPPAQPAPEPAPARAETPVQSAPEAPPAAPEQAPAAPAAPATNGHRNAEQLPPAPEPRQQTTEPAPARSQEATEDEMIAEPRQPVQQQQQPRAAGGPAGNPGTRQGETDADGLLVDWTFNPPPDVTPEELRAAGHSAPEPSQATAPVEEEADAESATPEHTETATPPAPVAREKVQEAATPSAPQEPVQQPAEAAPAPASSEGRMTVDVCVSNTIKEWSVGDPRVSDKKYNSIASREYTEVNKAFGNGGSPEQLKEELTHLAAVCLAWVDAIEKRQADSPEANAA